MIAANKLLGKIYENGFNLTSFSSKIGISRTALRNKLQGITDFTVSEMANASDALNLSESETVDIFLRSKSPKWKQTEQK